MSGRKAIAGTMVLAVFLVAFVALAGCGGDGSAGNTGEPVEDSRPADTQPSSAPPKEATVEVFFIKGEEPSGYEREVKTGGAQSALYELLKGPTAAEEGEGAASLIPEGTRLNSYVVEGDNAAVDFSSEIKGYGGGSAAVMAITEQITRTVLTNDSSVTSVSITVDGVPAEEALQP